MRYLIWIFLIALAIFRFLTTQTSYRDGEFLRISGQVRQEPSVFPTSQRITLSNIKMYLPRFPEIHYGDRIIVTGEYQGGELKYPKLVSMADNSNFLIEFKRRLVSFWQSVLPEPHASLMAGITLGYKSNLSTSFLDQLRKTGTTHVVVASGMNVTFVAMFILTILLPLVSRKKALVISIAGIIAYCIITGLEAPVLRAALMTAFVFLAQLTGRVVQTMRIVFLSGLTMLVVRPSWATDIGFILSMASTISLIVFETKVYKRISFVPSIFRESLSTSLAAQVGVAPVIFLTFGQLNVLSPIINALVLWVVPLIMVIASVGGVVGLVVPQLGKLIVYLAYPLTSWFIWIVQIFSKI